MTGHHPFAAHRKPHNPVRRLAAFAVFVFVTAAVAAAAMLATSQPAPKPFNVPAQLGQVVTSPPAVQLTASVRGTAAEDYAACTAIEHYHHLIAVRAVIYDAWYHAWHLARSADPEMTWYIDRYLITGRGYGWIVGSNAVCTPDA